MRTIETNGVRLAVDDQGDGYPCVLVHGFPELAYSWRHQVPALADAGFRPVSYDLRGSGGSSGPAAIDEYSLKDQVGDVIGIIDRLGFDTVALIGHDWGSIITYATALSHPDRVSHVVSLNVPYLGLVAGFPPTDVIAAKFRDRLGYVLRFIDPEASEASFGRDPQRWLHRVYARVAADGPFMTEDEESMYVDIHSAAGLTGQFNLYRNIDRNLVDFKHLDRTTLTQPTLMVTVDHDPVLPKAMAAPMVDFVPDLTFAHVDDSGHWTQQEQPDAVNEILIAWLDERVP
jgi:pimeloyl-ACP methyl ester carboxylesterase